MRAACRQRKASAMKSVSSQVGPESNPLVDSINFSTWAICLPRWILKTRSDFAWHLRRS